MLDFLKDCGISNEVIKDIFNTYSEGNIYTLNSNEFEVIKIIDYFRQIGIDCIDELLVFNLEIFLCKFDEIYNKLNRGNLVDIVKEINEDYMFINNVVF